MNFLLRQNNNYLPPLGAYGNNQRIRSVFYRFTLLILVSLIAGLVIVLTHNNVLQAIIIAIAILPVLMSLYFIRRKNFEWAATFLVLVLIFMITLLATNDLGIHFIGNFGYPAVLIIASLVTRKRTMGLLTLFTIGCLAWLVFGELSGVYTPSVLKRSVPGDFFSASLTILVAAFMVRYLTETLFKTNLQLQQELTERQRTEKQLEQDIALRLQIEAEREKLITNLETKNAELERFTYTVSHDLKSPLITISGFVGFLEQDAQAGNLARVKEDVTHINNAVTRMQRLLSELLELSRVGRLINPPEEISFEEIAREAVALVCGRITAGDVQIEIAPGLPVVHGDRGRLIEAVQNLVENAVKFMGDQPHPRVEIGMRGTAEASIFYVHDNGIGIEPQYHEQIFGLFDKLDPQSEGTGVGLALVKRIVEVHGGKIWVESDGTGQGTTFWFTLRPTISQSTK